MADYRENAVEKRFYLGTNCNVVCLDQLSGQIIWRTPFQSSLGSMVVTLILHGGRIYAACHKCVACLDAADGKILWTARVASLGEPVAMALDLTIPGGQLLAAGGGHVYALTAETGALVWHNDLHGLGLHPICLRVPDAVTAQVIPRLRQSGNSYYYQPLEDRQLG